MGVVTGRGEQRPIGETRLPEELKTLKQGAPETREKDTDLYLRLVYGAAVHFNWIKRATFLVLLGLLGERWGDVESEVTILMEGMKIDKAEKVTLRARMREKK